MELKQLTNKNNKNLKTINMKKYIKNNLTPLIVGFAVAMMYNVLLNLIESIILKIALIGVR